MCDGYKIAQLSGHRSGSNLSAEAAALAAEQKMSDFQIKYMTHIYGK